MQRPEDQLEATENGPTHVNCGPQRIDADQRGFCAVPDSGRAVPDTSAFAPISHLGVFHADSSIFGDPLDQAGLPVRVRFNILRDDRLEQSSKTAERELPLPEAE